MHVFRLRGGEDGLEHVARVATPAAGAGPFAIAPDRRFLYLVLWGEKPAIATYGIDPATGIPWLLATVAAPAAPAHVAVDAGGRFLLLASYHGDSVAVLPIGREGVAQAEPAAMLQPGRNPHFIIPDPSNRFVYVPCLGSGHIAQYLFDEKTGDLRPNLPAVAATPHLAGPRHICFSPNNRFAFALCELNGEVIAYALDAGGGVLVEKQRISYMPPGSTLPPDGYLPPVNARDHAADLRIWGADIRITPDGRFLYASERTTGVIAAFAVDGPSGSLRYVGSYETEAQPRSFAVSPDGRFLVVAGEKSDGVSLHAIDAADGGLDRRSRHDVGKNPAWVEMIAL